MLSVADIRAIEDAIVARHPLTAHAPSLAADPSNRRRAVAQWIAAWMAEDGWNRQKVGEYLRCEATRMQRELDQDDDEGYVRPVSFQMLADIVEGMR